MMLVVTIDSDYAVTVGTVVKEIAEGIFQCGALAFVDLVVQQMDDVRMGSSFFFEIVQVFLLAAVVYKNNVSKAILKESFNDSVELFIGIQRGQNDRNTGTRFSTRHPCPY